MMNRKDIELERLALDNEWGMPGAFSTKDLLDSHLEALDEIDRLKDQLRGRGTTNNLGLNLGGW